MTTRTRRGSASLEQPDYWWYRARADLLGIALGPFLGEPVRVLDVGSADGPSVGWMDGNHQRVAMDVYPRGLSPGVGVCGSALALPFADETFDVVAAFDVLEHCEPEDRAMSELTRVLRPGGRLLMSVPAYQWAWTDHDVQAGHHRRYTRSRLVQAVEQAGLTVRRATYAFSAVFPFFVAERVARRVRSRSTSQTRALTPVSGPLDRLLMAMTGFDRWMLARRDLFVGSSIFVAAVKPAESSKPRQPSDGNPARSEV